MDLGFGASAATVLRVHTRKLLKKLVLPIAAFALLTDLAIGALDAEVTAAPEFDSQANADIVQNAQFTGVLARRNSAASRSADREYPEGNNYAPISITVDSANPDSAAVPDGIAVEPASIIVPGERADTRMEIRTVTDPFERIERQDSNRFSDLPPVVVQAGRNGELTRVYRYTDNADAAVGHPVLEIVASTRQDEIIAIGTRQRPAPTPFYGDSVTGGIPESVWVALAQCESGGRPSVISAGGRFHGLYQFSVATWRSVGGEGLPSEASPQEQRYRAVRLQARSGWGQWPACSRRIGVR